MDSCLALLLLCVLSQTLQKLIVFLTGNVLITVVFLLRLWSGKRVWRYLLKLKYP